MRFTWLFLLLALLLPASAHGQSQIQLHWETYDTVVDVNADGSLHVSEQQVLVVDSGTLRRMTRTFATGDQGRVSGVRVSEDGTAYTRGSGTPGTYSGSDDGTDANIQLWFSDPSKDRHTFTIDYTVKDALALSGDRVLLDWNFFWSTSDAPEVRSGSVVLNFPQQINAADLQIETSGAAVKQTAAGNSLRWQLTGPIQGEDLNVQTTFPRAVLATDAEFRSGATTATGDSGFNPNAGTSAAPSLIPGGFGLIFCIIVLVVLVIAFSVIRSSMRGRGGYAGGYRRDYNDYGPSYGPGPFGGPSYRRRGRSGGYGGWGVPIFPPRFPGGGGGGRSSGPFDSGPSDSSGGGDSSWDSSGGSDSSWDSSGGSDSSWDSSGGSNSFWGAFGGGGSSRRSSGGSSRRSSGGGGGRRSGGGGRGGGGFG